MSTSLKTKQGPALTAIALAAALSLTGCGTAAPAPGHSDQLALGVLNSLTAGDVKTATNDFSPAMAQTLPAADLTQRWKRYQELLGDYKSHGQPQDVVQGPLTVVNLPLGMAKKPGQLRITVDQSGHVAGLFMLDSNTPMPAPTPAVPAPVPGQAAGSPTGAPRVDLTSAHVQIGNSYSVSISGFAPGENVKFSWTGPTQGAMGATPAGADGRGAMPNPIVEQDPPGNYNIIATGEESGKSATTPLQVVADTQK